MRHLISILAALLFCAAPAQTQTLKALAYNTSNGVVVANTGTLTFTNASVFPQINSPDLGAGSLTVEGAIYFTETLTNVSVTRANLGFSTNLNTLWTATNIESFYEAINFIDKLISSLALGNIRDEIATIQVQKASSVADSETGNSVLSYDSFGNANTPWSVTQPKALSRAISGSTNTNHPYSGSISVTGTNNTNTLVFSNGILQSVQ